MTQKQAITKAVFSGKKLSMMDGFKLFGTMNLHKRIGEIEDKYEVKLTRTPKKFKTRYGTHGHYTEYHLDTNRYKKATKKALKDVDN
jgi:hypothetical protein